MLRVNPTTGRLLVSGTGGGGGLTKELPVGAIDGNNNTYTVDNVPTLLFLAGQYQAVAGDDVDIIDYTISGSGPYTLSFNDPPVSGPLVSFF